MMIKIINKSEIRAIVREELARIIAKNSEMKKAIAMSHILNNAIPKDTDNLDDLTLSARASNVMNNIGILTINQLCSYSAREFVKFRNCGSGVVYEIETKLAMIGRKLRSPNANK